MIWIRHLRAAFVAKLRGFRENTSGGVTLEALMLFPVMVTVLLISVIWYDVTRFTSITQKATFAFADGLSRSRGYVEPIQLDALALISGVATGVGGETSMQVSAYQCFDSCDNPVDRNMVLCWAWHSQSSIRPLRNDSSESVADAKTRLPLIPPNVMVLLVEQQAPYAPPFNVMPDVIQPGYITYDVATSLRSSAWASLVDGGKGISIGTADLGNDCLSSEI